MSLPILSIISIIGIGQLLIIAYLNPKRACPEPTHYRKIMKINEKNFFYNTSSQ